MMKLFALALVALIALSASLASAEQVGVTFGGQYVVANVFDAASAGKTAAQWYNYNQNSNPGYRDSAHTAEGLETQDILVWAFVRGTDGLALAMIFDAPGDADGGSATIEGTCTGPSCATLTYLQADDTNEGPQDFSANPFTGSWTWATCCTDGAVIGTFGGCQTITARITQFTGLNGAVIASSDLAGGYTVVASKAVDDEISFQFGDTCPAPVSDCVCENYTAGSDCNAVSIAASNKCACISFDDAVNECNPSTADSTSACQ